MSRRGTIARLLYALTASTGAAFLASMGGRRRPRPGAATTAGAAAPRFFYNPSGPGAEPRLNDTSLVDRLHVDGGFLRNDTQVLWSYASNLRRARSETAAPPLPKETLLKPAKSLLRFLQSHTRPARIGATALDRSGTAMDEALVQAGVEAIRTACAVNDYRLVLRLVEALRHYRGTDRGGGAVVNRVLGHAVRYLRETSININKIKKVWEMMDPAAVTPHEVNAMLEALAEHAKPNAALRLFRQHLSEKQVDAYSVGILLKMLTDSVQDEQEPNYQVYSIHDRRLRSIVLSSCWQWKEAVQILDESSSVVTLNNPIFSNLIRLDERAGQVFGPREHPSHAMATLKVMKEHGILPDQMTCALVLGASHPWRTSWQLFAYMLQEQGRDSGDGTLAWRLPRPNVYCYSAAITACARARQYPKVLDLLNTLWQDASVEVNTFIYNGVLRSLLPGGQHRRAKERLLMALDILRRMMIGKHESIDSGSIHTPDTMTFNTVLNILASVQLARPDWEHVQQYYPAAHDEESLAHLLIDDMMKWKVLRDASSYRFALSAVRSGGSKSVERMLERALADELGGIQHGTELMNSALAALSLEGQMDVMLQTIYKMVDMQLGIRPDKETLNHLIECLGHGNRSHLVPALLLAADGDEEGIQRLSEENITLPLSFLPSASADTFTSAIIRTCLKNGDFISSRRILQQMQERGIGISPIMMQQVAKHYAIAALSVTHRSRTLEKHLQGAAQMHASKALVIVDGLKNVSVSLVALTSRACAESGLFCDALRLLRMLHQSLLSRLRAGVTMPGANSLWLEGGVREELILPTLHRRLMRSFGAHGNVSAALMCSQDIQKLSNIFLKEVRASEEHTDGLELNAYHTYELLSSSLSMGLPEWSSLIEAAFDSGDWKVCSSTLQSLQPYAERLHPSLGRNESDSQFAKDYYRVSAATSKVVQCLVIHEKYNDAMRMIEKWILWTGRRPPFAAFARTLQALCNKGRDKDVLQLVATSLRPPASPTEAGWYELSLFVSAISRLSEEGMYAAADEVFLSAVTRGSLPLDLDSTVSDGKSCMLVDLHGMNLAVARSAVRIALHKHMIEIMKGARDANSDVIIVTGRGLGSALRMRPVLRPEVQRMLLEEFYPPLNTQSLPGNMGALKVSYSDVHLWVDHQNLAKKAYMKSVATALKKLSSTDRLRKILESAYKSSLT